MAKRTCSVGTCGRPVAGLGWCQGHWRRHRKTGDVQADKPFRKWQRQVGEPDRCVFADCPKPGTGGRGWCHMHYKRWQTHGDPGVNRQRVAKPCKVSICDRTRRIQGYCTAHFERLARGGDVQADVPIVRGGWRPPRQTCSAAGCGDLVKSRGLCSSHYWKRHRAEIAADPERLAKYKEYHQSWHKAWRTANPDRVRELSREWRASNPDLLRLAWWRRRAYKLSALNIPFAPEQLDARMRYWGYRCWMCGGPFEHVDHVKPLSKGGAHALANLRPACRACNVRKKDNWPYPLIVGWAIGGPNWPPTSLSKAS
jgi:5-methylcytosine-specific restriction endonuclease McrA